MPEITMKNIPIDILKRIAGLEPKEILELKKIETSELLMRLKQEPTAYSRIKQSMSIDPTVLSKLMECDPSDSLQSTQMDHHFFSQLHQIIIAQVYRGYLNLEDRAIVANVSKSYRDAFFGDKETRETIMTERLLLAVAYGMESKDVNDILSDRHTGGLFKSNLFAKDLLIRSPEFLLTRGNLTDWAGRTFKDITAFEYALWAEDFRMIMMMLSCIPTTSEGDAIRHELYLQYQQIKKPVMEGGGLTYTLKYERPNLNEEGIPDGTFSEVAEIRTENHFDLMPLLEAYKDYEQKYDVRTLEQRDLYWVNIIGRLQHLLPIHILQRYCDTSQPFSSSTSFEDTFKRSCFCVSWRNSSSHPILPLVSLFTIPFWTDSALYRGAARPMCLKGLAQDWLIFDEEPIRKLMEVNSTVIEEIIRQKLSTTDSVNLCNVS